MVAGIIQARDVLRKQNRTYPHCDKLYQGLSTMIIPTSEQMAIFGANEGIWEYRSFDDEFICFVVRYEINGTKDFKPFTLKNNKLIKQWFRDSQNNTLKEKPLYGLNKLKLYPNKDILIVEGEKTADKTQELFPEYVVLAWYGGGGQAKNVDLTYLKNKKICLWPDKDDAGYKAMEILKERLQWVASEIGMTNPRSLNVIKPSKIGRADVDKYNCGWDLADLDIQNGEYDFDYIKLMIEKSFNQQKEFDVSSYPELTESRTPKPLDTTKNFNHLVSFYNISLRWNIMKRECEVIIPGKEFYYEEKDNEALTYLENLAITHSFNIKRVGKHMDAIALANRYHPVRDWLLSKPLQDSSILDKFIKIIKTTDDDLSHLLLKRWMLSAIGVLFNEGEFVAQGVLVLHGKGGWRKTTFISMLAPSELKAIKKGSELDPSNKDNLIRLAKYWIAELGELGGTINKSDANKLKSHITNELDEARRAYAAKDSHMIRRTIYAGTVNEENFLVDETGNRRWWVVSLRESIDTEAIKKLDIQQVWRAVYELYLQGERPYLNDQEVERLNQSNEKYERISPFDEKLDSYFDWDSPERIYMSSTEILVHIGYEKPAVGDPNRMANILIKRKVPRGTGAMRRHYLMPRSLFDKQREMTS